MTPSPTKIDWEFVSSLENIKPPASATMPVIIPFSMVMRAVPSGTIIFDPSEIIFLLASVFDPLP